VHRAVEVCPGLLGREPKVVGPYLDQSTVCPQLGQGQRRVGPGGEDDANSWSAVLPIPSTAVWIAVTT
jgi:hypothetical protein